MAVLVVGGVVVVMFGCRDKWREIQITVMLFMQMMTILVPKCVKSRNFSIRTAYLTLEAQSGLRAKRDFRVKPCIPTKSNVTFCRCIITGKTPPQWSHDRETLRETYTLKTPDPRVFTK